MIHSYGIAINCTQTGYMRQAGYVEPRLRVSMLRLGTFHRHSGDDNCSYYYYHCEEHPGVRLSRFERDKDLGSNTFLPLWSRAMSGR